ncbi:MAG: hypothetical protein DIU78_003430 [Pseudomonadota bacterium]
MTDRSAADLPALVHRVHITARIELQIAKTVLIAGPAVQRGANNGQERAETWGDSTEHGARVSKGRDETRQGADPSN